MAEGRRETSRDIPVRIRVLGPVVIEGPNGSVEVRGRQAGAIVAFLALERRPTTRDELAELLWGMNPSSHWQGALRGVLSKVRAAWVEAGLPGDEIRSTDALVRLDTRSITTDLDDIEGLLTGPHLVPAHAQLTAATGVLAQPFLPHDDSEWGTRIRQRIEGATRRVVHLHARQLIGAGSDEMATAVLEQAIAHDPLDETAYHLLIEARLRLGQRASAGNVYETLTTQLAAEFGISPSPATSALLTSASGNLDSASGSTRRSDPLDDARPEARRASIHPHSADPFAGRRMELDQLEGIWRRVVDERRPQLVVIQGAPGMGKTRLVDEFCSDRGRPPIRRVVWGRNRGSVDRAYGALAEAIERLLADEPHLIDRLGQHIRGLLPLLPHLAQNADRPPQPDDDSARTHLIHSLRALVMELMDEPTVWFVDDLQWASADALGVVEAALDGVVGPLLVVATSRYPPSEIAAGLASLQRVVTSTSIHLEGLSVDEVGELFHDADVARTVQERTAGLPFYASEIARLGRLTGTIDLDAVPSTIADWVTRRVRALDRSHAQVLQLASVIGNEFDLELLARCSSVDALEVAAITDELVNYGLLSYRAEPGNSPTQASVDSALQFTHMITRDIVYSGIGLGTRTQLHRRVAEVIEAQPNGSQSVAALAHHYAHSAASCDRRRANTPCAPATRRWPPVHGSLPKITSGAPPTKR